MSGQASVRERSGSRLSKDELRVLRFIEEDFATSGGPVKDALVKWAAVTWRQYVTAGFNPEAVTQRLPAFMKLLEDELADLHVMFLAIAKIPDPLEKAANRAQHKAENVASAQAAKTLVERLRQQSWRHHSAEKSKR